MNIYHQIFIKASPETVYRTITTEEGWNAWFTDYSDIHLDENGTGTIILGWRDYGLKKEDIKDGGNILSAVPNKSFNFQWCPGEDPTTVKVELMSFREGTLLFLEEEGYKTSPKDLSACIACAVGWGEAFMMLKMYLEFGIVCKEDFKF